MAGMAVQGYKETGLKGLELETSLLRAERKALAEQTGANLGAQVLALGQVVRAQLGVAEARSTLKTWGEQEIPVVNAPDPALQKTQPAEFVKGEKAFTEYTRATSRKAYALLGLALLGEPGVGDRALAEIKKPEADNRGPAGMIGAMLGGMRPGRGMPNFGATAEEPLILAAIASDPQLGLKGLLEYCADESTSFSRQSGILSTLVRMAPGAKARQSWSSKFSLTTDIGAQLPADIYAQLAKPYTDALKRWKPEDFRNMQAGITLASAGADFPAKTLPADAITFFLELKDKLAQNPMAGAIRGQLDALIKKQGGDPNAGVKPPTPPKDF